MRKIICAVFDSAGGFFGRPLCYDARNSAIREFRDAVNKEHEDNLWYHHPEHFNLVGLGEMDMETGTITPYETGPVVFDTGLNAAAPRLGGK